MKTTPQLITYRDDWLLFDAAAPPGTREAWSLLERNADLGCGLKFARAVGRPGMRLRAEVPRGLPFDLARRVDEVQSAFSAAGVAIELDPTLGELASPPVAPPSELDLEAVCRDDGWELDRHADGSLAIDLAVPGAFHPARIERHDSGEVALRVELPLPDAIAGAPRKALTRLLLLAAGAFRMVRPCASSADGVTRARLEIVLPGGVSAPELLLALGALAVATRRCAREAELVAAHDDIARSYLEATSGARAAR